MKNNYSTYFLTLATCLFANPFFSLRFLPLIEFLRFFFLTGLLHVAISTWLFLFWNKPGRVVAITTSVCLLILPFAEIFTTIKYDGSFAISYVSILITLIIKVFPLMALIYIHVKNFNKFILMNNTPRIIMMLIPISLAIIYLIFLSNALSSSSGGRWFGYEQITIKFEGTIS